MKSESFSKRSGCSVGFVFSLDLQKSSNQNLEPLKSKLRLSQTRRTSSVLQQVKMTAIHPQLLNLYPAPHRKGRIYHQVCKKKFFVKQKCLLKVINCVSWRECILHNLTYCRFSKCLLLPKLQSVLSIAKSAVAALESQSIKGIL